MKVLFIGKLKDPHSEEAAKFLSSFDLDLEVVWSSRGEAYPEHLRSWSGDLVLSYLSQWIIPASTLNGAKFAALNWHPGTPEYPGIGCTNFAVYEGAPTFGMTCHHMNPKVDTGSIVEVRRFEVEAEDDVFSMTQKCYVKILESFKSVLTQIIKEKALPKSDEHWTRRPFRRTELDALCVLDLNMDEAEMKRRIKATKYDKHWAFIEINGIKFVPTPEA